MMFSDDDEEKRRRRDDAEEERHYWDSIEEEKRAEEERDAERRTVAIATMEKWFFEQFEDPQNEMPRDGEDQTYIYPWGGPFEASDVLHGQFDYEYDKDLIDAAVEQIERDGTTEWAPSSSGDYYEHPDREPDEQADAATRAELTGRILERLDKLEAAVAAMPGQPGNIGHNAPPDDVGLPPYGEEDAADITAAIAETRAELGQSEPDPAQLATLSRRFDGWGRKLGSWLAKKGDLAVDELIKNGMKVLTWGGALALFNELAHDLLTLAQHLLARF